MCLQHLVQTIDLYSCEHKLTAQKYFFYSFKIHWCSLYQLASIHTRIEWCLHNFFFYNFPSVLFQFFEFHFTYWAVQMLLINNFPMGRYRAIEPWLNSYPKATQRVEQKFSKIKKRILWVNEMILTHSGRFGIQALFLCILCGWIIVQSVVLLTM